MTYVTLAMGVDAEARDAVQAYILKSGDIAHHIAVEALRQLDYARLTGALPGEVGFDYSINIQAYLR